MAKNQARERQGSYITLYRYFNTKADMLLQDPRGSLAKQVPSTRIMSANEEVRPLLAHLVLPQVGVQQDLENTLCTVFRWRMFIQRRFCHPQLFSTDEMKSTKVQTLGTLDIGTVSHWGIYS